MAMATCVFTWSNWFSMSRMTCLIMISGCSALSISSFKFARIKVETLSSNAITPPKSFQTAFKARLHVQIACAYVAARQTAAARASRSNQHAGNKSHAQPEEPATSHKTSNDSQHRPQYQSDE